MISALAVLAGCSKSTTEAPHKQQVAEVGVFKVAPEALQITTELPGRTAAYQVAEVRPQVSGLIQKRLFVEGADVKAGVPLYQIDAATYQAAYNSAKAALAKAKANLVAAAPKVARYKDLVAIEGVSRQDYDDAVAAHEQAKADVESATAALEQAKINLDYTHVDAPISGRISRSAVTPGALVTANQTTALTTVQQLDPIYVDVTQTSEDMLRLKREIESGGEEKRRPGQGDLAAVGRHQVRAGRQAAILRRDGRSGHRQRDLARAVPESEARSAAWHVRARRGRIGRE
jgi:membrane fusion protein (multidrug efflux system)